MLKAIIYILFIVFVGLASSCHKDTQGTILKPKTYKKKEFDKNKMGTKRWKMYNEHGYIDGPKLMAKREKRWAVERKKKEREAQKRQQKLEKLLAQQGLQDSTANQTTGTPATEENTDTYTDDSNDSSEF